MTILNKLIDEENARRVAEEFIADRYPFGSVTFEKAELRTNETYQFYRFFGYSRLAKWPASIVAKKMCEVRVDVNSADIIGFLDYNKSA